MADQGGDGRAADPQAAPRQLLPELSTRGSRRLANFSERRRAALPGHDGEPWSLPAYQSWRRRTFKRAADAAGIDSTTRYPLRHSFASLLLHEGRPVIYVAHQLGHDARLTLSR